jgi:spore cortex formation protein SpoVR/YcgB (stage V sporulation)
MNYAEGQTMADWDVKDLEYWDEKIREKVEEFGLSCYPQEFELCDHFQMLGYMAYVTSARVLQGSVVFSRCRFPLLSACV